MKINYNIHESKTIVNVNIEFVVVFVRMATSVATAVATIVGTIVATTEILIRLTM